MTGTARAQERDSKAEYETAWSQLDGWIEQCIRDGMTDPAAIAREVTRFEREQFLGQAAFQDYYQPVHPGVPQQRLGIRQRAYHLFPFEHRDPEIIDTLAQFVAANPAQVDTVVELGSGTGRNLFVLAERLRAAGAGPIAFHACEYTEAGRRAATRLDSVGGRRLLSVHAFDYRRPDLSFLDGSRNVLFFSVHSLEQITSADEAIVAEMLGRSRACHCIHFEPVGWQLDPQLVAFRERIDRTGFRDLDSLRWKAARALDKRLGTRLARGFKGIPLRDVVIGSAARTSLNAARWSARFGYNKNLVQLLRAQQGAGRIEIFREEPDVFGENPFNPSTILGWSKRR